MTPDIDIGLGFAFKVLAQETQTLGILVGEGSKHSEINSEI